MSAPVELAPGLHLVTGPSNAYLWLGTDGVTVVDTGLAGSTGVILEALEALGRRREDVARLLVTHAHPDHAGGASTIASWGRVEVLAGAGDAEVVAGLRPAPEPVVTDAERPLHEQVSAHLPPAPPVRVDRVLQDGQAVDPSGELLIVATPGHTPGSISVHVPSRRAVLTGDVAIEVDGQVVLGPFNADRGRALASLRRLGELDVDVAGLGHGAPVLSRAAAVLAAAPDVFA